MKKQLSLFTAVVIMAGMLALAGCSSFSSKNDNPPLSVQTADAQK